MTMRSSSTADCREIDNGKKHRRGTGQKLRTLCKYVVPYVLRYFLVEIGKILVGANWHGCVMSAQVPNRRLLGVNASSPLAPLLTSFSNLKALRYLCRSLCMCGSAVQMDLDWILRNATLQISLPKMVESLLKSVRKCAAEWLDNQVESSVSPYLLHGRLESVKDTEEIVILQSIAEPGNRGGAHACGS
jgi:hypothetical protein